MNLTKFQKLELKYKLAQQRNESIELEIEKIHAKMDILTTKWDKLEAKLTSLEHEK